MMEAACELENLAMQIEGLEMPYESRKVLIDALNKINAVFGYPVYPPSPLLDADDEYIFEAVCRGYPIGMGMNMICSEAAKKGMTRKQVIAALRRLRKIGRCFWFYNCWHTHHEFHRAFIENQKRISENNRRGED